MDKLSDDDFLNELIKRSEIFADQECKKFAVEELEKIKAEIEQCCYNDNYVDGVIIFKRDMDDVFNEHISELKRRINVL